MSTLTQPTNAALITELQFNQYTTSWMEVLEDPTEGLLQSCFTPGGSSDTRMRGFSFETPDIIRVLSTVGLHTIMVRFGITTEHRLFIPILVGYDRSGSQVTPYYVGKLLTHEGGRIPEQMQTPLSDQVPDVLASQWITNWNLPEQPIDKSLFHTSYGYLRGYTFLMQDFLNDLFLLKRKEGTCVLVYLALHTYCDSGSQTKSTFGLVISAQSSSNSSNLPGDDSRANTIDSQIYYDLSAPCPPTC
jgi:hypothetical protein